jgi:hypothetical protein
LDREVEGAEKLFKKVKIKSLEAFTYSLMTRMTDMYILYANSVQIEATSMEILLPEYNYYQEVFDERNATALPDYSPHKLLIALEEGKQPPFSPLYNLLGTEIEIL